MPYIAPHDRAAAIFAEDARREAYEEANERPVRLASEGARRRMAKKINTFIASEQGEELDGWSLARFEDMLRELARGVRCSRLLMIDEALRNTKHATAARIADRAAFFAARDARYPTH